MAWNPAKPPKICWTNEQIVKLLDLIKSDSELRQIFFPQSGGPRITSQRRYELIKPMTEAVFAGTPYGAWLEFMTPPDDVPDHLKGALAPIRLPTISKVQRLVQQAAPVLMRMGHQYRSPKELPNGQPQQIWNDVKNLLPWLFTIAALMAGDAHVPSPFPEPIPTSKSSSPPSDHNVVAPRKRVSMRVKQESPGSSTPVAAAIKTPNKQVNHRQPRHIQEPSINEPEAGPSSARDDSPPWSPTPSDIAFLARAFRSSTPSDIGLDEVDSEPFANIPLPPDDSASDFEPEEGDRHLRSQRLITRSSRKRRRRSSESTAASTSGESSHDERARQKVGWPVPRKRRKLKKADLVRPGSYYACDHDPSFIPSERGARRLYRSMLEEARLEANSRATGYVESYCRRWGHYHGAMFLPRRKSAYSVAKEGISTFRRKNSVLPKLWNYRVDSLNMLRGRARRGQDLEPGFEVHSKYTVPSIRRAAIEVAKAEVELEVAAKAVEPAILEIVASGSTEDEWDRPFTMLHHFAAKELRRRELGLPWVPGHIALLRKGIHDALVLCHRRNLGRNRSALGSKLIMNDDDGESSDFEILDVPPKHLSRSTGSPTVRSAGERWETPAYSRAAEVIEVDDEDEDNDADEGPQAVQVVDEDMEEGEVSTTAPAAPTPTYVFPELKPKLHGNPPVHGVDFASRLDRLRVAEDKWNAIKNALKQDPDKKPDEAYQAVKTELEAATVSYAALKRGWKATMEREADLEFKKQMRHLKALFGDPPLGNEKQIYKVMFKHDMELRRPWSYFEHEKFEWKKSRWHGAAWEKREKEARKKEREAIKRDKEAHKRAKEVEARRRAADARRELDAVQLEGTQAREQRAQGHVARRDAALADPTPAPRRPAREQTPKPKKKQAKKKKAKASTRVKTEVANQAAKKDKKKKYYKPQVKTEAKPVVKTELKVHVKKEIKVKAEPT